ncbi:MAG: winged helix-turn-helix domain-containing protein [Candidatus Njordarchaeota archaeon]
MDMEDIFKTNLQVRIIKLFLGNPERMFSTTMVARKLKSSPSAVISRLRELEKLGIIKVIQISRMKLYKLDLNNEITKVLLDFFKKISSL